MCGISGIYKKNNNFQGAPDTIFKMTQIQTHRGPDDTGFYNDDHINLGHCRLAIIDLTDTGKQPMCNEDGTVWIVYDGEIYNFKALKKILSEEGHKFKSNSDTEVIIHSYEEWGGRGI